MAGGVWEAALTWLTETPEVEAKMLFEHLLMRLPGVGGCGWLGTTHVSTPRQAVAGGERSAEGGYFPQIREPGKSLQFDWTRVKMTDFRSRLHNSPSGTCSHTLKLEPQTIHVDSPDETGDVEAVNGQIERMTVLRFRFMNMSADISRT